MFTAILIACLAIQETARQVPLVRDTIELVKDVVNFTRGSPLRMRVRVNASGLSLYSHATLSLRPLCPTRWVVRAKSIQSVLNNYEALMHAMEEVSFASDDAGAKANGFLK